jgi:uncharacterized protein (PEP-CTERM system associated)
MPLRRDPENRCRVVHPARIAMGDEVARATGSGPALKFVVVAMCCIAAAPAFAENWRTSASASATETYTTNVDYAPQGQTTDDFATTLSAAFSIHGEGARVKLDGTIAASWLLYAGQTQNNSIAPSVNLSGRVEAIEKFAFVEASANVSTSFLSPFGPQPASLVNATNNRYISETYTVSPYIKGVLGSTNISYQVRDDNYWTAASSFGNSSNKVPNTYANQLNAYMNSGTNPFGWRLEYNRFYYDNGIQIGNDGTNVNPGNYTLQTVRLIVPYQIDPQLQVSGRVGYEKDQFPTTSNQGTIYGAGMQWNPTDRTQAGGFWEHQFFGSSYSWQISHRLPNAAISANFTRGLTSFPQLALVIPAGTTVAQFLDAAFTTRIPDPVARAIAVEEFLAQTGLPPTLAAPVNFYGTSITLQNVESVSLVLIGVRNSVTFTVFNVVSDAISGQGSVLPPALQFGQNNTQTGAGVSYSYQLSGFTNLVASASYSRTTTNQTSLNDLRSNNGNAGLTLSTKFGPKTTGSAGITYSIFQPTGASNVSNTSSVNVFAGITHTFW